MPASHLDNEGRTALHNAAVKAHIDVVRGLLRFGAEICVKDNDGATPHDLAQSCHKYEVVDALETAEQVFLDGARFWLQYAGRGTDHSAFVAAVQQGVNDQSLCQHLLELILLYY